MDDDYPTNTNITFKALEKNDIPSLVAVFQQANWPKPASLFEGYLHEQQQQKRLIWLALANNNLAGYITLTWQSLYQPFAQQHIPEIMDLNVLPAFRRQGIASLLLNKAEEKASMQSHIVGIGVGLYGGADGGYGAAQRLYIKRGYLPDGLGVTYDYKPAIPGHAYCLDDELILWFTKKLR